MDGATFPPSYNNAIQYCNCHLCCSMLFQQMCQVIFNLQDRVHKLERPVRQTVKVGENTICLHVLALSASVMSSTKPFDARAIYRFAALDCLFGVGGKKAGKGL